MRVRHPVDAGPGAGGAAMLLPARVGPAEHAAVAAGEDVIPVPGRRPRGCERPHPGRGEVPGGVVAAGVEVVPPGPAMVGPAEPGFVEGSASHFAEGSAEPLGRVIAPPALVPRVAEPPDAAPIEPDAEPPVIRVRVIVRPVAPGERRREVRGAVPAGIVVAGAV